MTLWYKLLGMPGNEQEFIERMKRKGISGLDIILDETIRVYRDRQLMAYQCFPVLWAEERMLNLKADSGRCALPNNDNGALEILNMREKMFNGRILSLAKKYQQQSFKVTIAGKPVGEATEEFKKSNSQQRVILSQKLHA